jgi:hypothetical protein
MINLGGGLMTQRTHVMARRDAVKKLVAAACIMSFSDAQADFPPGLASQADAGATDTALSNDGCSISTDRFNDLARSFSEARSSERHSSTYVPRSGDSAFDQALAMTLGMLVHAFDVLPAFTYYDDSGAENAKASKDDSFGRKDGTVMFGLSFLRTLRARNEAPEVGVACVCAHEFGHIVQNKLNLGGVLRQGQATVKRLELHADCLAGYFAGLRQLQRPTFPVDVFRTTQFSIGDNSFSDPEHHGTAEERGSAVVHGYKASHDLRLSLADAVQDSLNYVLRL